MPLERSALKFCAGNLSNYCKWRHRGPNGDEKHAKCMVKSSGARMYVFLGNALPDMSDFYKLGASLPASLAGVFFPEKNPVLFYVCKTLFVLCFSFGEGLEKSFEPTRNK